MPRRATTRAETPDLPGGAVPCRCKERARQAEARRLQRQGLAGQASAGR